MGQNRDKLLQLQQELEQKLDLAGWPREARKFSGHLTLCRIRNSRAGIKLAKLIREYEDLKLSSMPVDSVSVYQSQLTPKGPIYTALGRFELQ
jgi:2'-5' RNA ligase